MARLTAGSGSRHASPARQTPPQRLVPLVAATRAALAPALPGASTLFLLATVSRVSTPPPRPRTPAAQALRAALKSPRRASRPRALLAPLQSRSDPVWAELPGGPYRWSSMVGRAVAIGPLVPAAGPHPSSPASALTASERPPLQAAPGMGAAELTAAAVRAVTAAGTPASLGAAARLVWAELVGRAAPPQQPSGGRGSYRPPRPDHDTSSPAKSFPSWGPALRTPPRRPAPDLLAAAGRRPRGPGSPQQAPEPAAPSEPAAAPPPWRPPPSSSPPRATALGASAIGATAASTPPPRPLAGPSALSPAAAPPPARHSRLCPRHATPPPTAPSGAQSSPEPRRPRPRSPQLAMAEPLAKRRPPPATPQLAARRPPPRLAAPAAAIAAHPTAHPAAPPLPPLPRLAPWAGGLRTASKASPAAVGRVWALGLSGLPPITATSPLAELEAAAAHLAQAVAGPGASPRQPSSLPAERQQPAPSLPLPAGSVCALWRGGPSDGERCSGSPPALAVPAAVAFACGLFGWNAHCAASRASAVAELRALLRGELEWAGAAVPGERVLVAPGVAAGGTAGWSAACDGAPAVLVRLWTSERGPPVPPA